MAKKKAASKKKTSKKTAKKKAAGKSARPASKKSSAKKTAKKGSKKVTKKKTAKKKAAKKSTKKTSKKTSKKTAKKKPAAKKSASKKAASKKTTKKPAAKKTTKKPAPAKPAESAKGGASKDAKSGRKGITIVNEKKNTRRSRPNSKAKLPPKPDMPSLLGPGSRFKGPLIPSGPKNPVAAADADGETGKKKKSPFTKRQLDKFKEILLRKRAEVFGDLEELETGALRSGGSGSLSNLPQHFAEQGSDSADQNLSLNLAEADRVLIKEIDAALGRIADRTYGLCEMTNQPIKEARLKELPWARYSIEAARRMEQGRA